MERKKKMKISDLVKILEQAKDIHGDVNVKVRDCSAQPVNIEEVIPGPINSEEDPCIVIDW